MKAVQAQRDDILPSSNDGAKLQITPLGTTAMLLDVPGELSLLIQQKIWALARVAGCWSQITEAVPGMNNLMLILSEPPRSHAQWLNLAEALRRAWEAAEPLALQGRVVDLPVIYGGEAGPHIADVMAHTGYALEDIVAIHSAPLYPVYALGSHPGYCYLGGMDPRIATPRRKSPILDLPAGSVSIGGVQTGVSASAGPSGWNTIGRTALAFFDHRQPSPALLQPGDLIRFHVQEIRS
jgi:KipI family sensor histidine kinase inhibitor